MALSTLERQRQIAQFVHNQERVSVLELCDRFAISLATARRDLDTLAEQGKIQRVHGGAVALHTNGRVESLPALPRAAEQADEKARIGAASAALVQDGETIFLGSGTTVLEMALRMRDRRRLNVITNSLLVLNVLTLTTAADITVVSLGGLFNRAEMSFIGHITQQSLSEVRADRVFLGIGAVDVQHGLTNTDLQETLTDRAILKIGREVVLLADHTKCGRAAAAFVAPLSAVQTLITDTATPQKFVDGVRAAGVRVITA